MDGEITSDAGGCRIGCRSRAFTDHACEEGCAEKHAVTRWMSGTRARKDEYVLTMKSGWALESAVALLLL